MDNLHFSEEEIEEQLAALGYKNIPRHRLCEFKQDLDDLVRRGEWKRLVSSAQMHPATSQPSPPAFTKEKVGHCYFQSSGEGFFLHAGKVDHDRRQQVLSSCQSRDCEEPRGRCDSYARHSVALNLRLPPGAPGKLQVEEEEEEPDETLHPPLTDSYASTPDSHRGRLIKRKVLRKHKGQSLVCDESVYSEEAFCLHRSHTSAGVQVANMYKMYSTQWDDDKNSLSSSFWSDGDRREGEEDEEEKVVIGEGDFKPVSNAEESYNDASGKEEEIGEEDSKAVGVSEDSYREASEEEEVEIERVIREEDSKPVTDAEDSLQESSEEEEEDSNPLSDSEDSYQEDSEEEDDSKPPGNSEDSHQEEEEEIEGVISVEESKPVTDAEDSSQESLKNEEESKFVGEAEDSLQEEEKDSNPLSNSEDFYQEDSEEEGVETERAISEEDSKPSGDVEDSLREASEEENDSKPPGNPEDSHQEEGIGRVISEEESKPVGDAEDSLQESSEEEEDSNPLSDSEDSYQEDSEEEGVEIERAISEEDSKPVSNTEDSLQEASEKEDDSKPPGNVEDSHQEKEEEIEGVISEEESKPVGDAEDSLQESSEEEEDSNHLSDSEDFYQGNSEEEKSELNNQVNINGESLEGGHNDDEEQCCSSSSDSPAPSLMTSGYGTYKPEELEGGEYRDDHTITEFDQDSRGDLSEMRDDEEDDRSLCSFGWFDLKPTEPDYMETEADVALCGDDDLQKEVDGTDTNPEEDKDQATEEKFEVDLHAMAEDEVTNATSEERQFCNTVVEDKVDVKNSEGGSDDEGDKQYEMLEDVRDRKEEKEIEDKVELEDPDESSSNKDIKFIDSKVDFSQTTFDKMCEDWEGNLRQTKASCLEERLADLRLSSSAQRDFETEIEDVTGQSDTQSSETDGVSFSAFDSYIRGMTRTQSDGDLRPKPKSFIRPAMSQQTLKKTDPVAKYFEYKQHWAMHKVPGEDERRSERREIKERLAYRPPPPKPRRVYVPNTYVVPTEKKRSALCWRIRNDLANGLLPHKFSHEF